jgi:hypothetical protein
MLLPKFSFACNRFDLHFEGSPLPKTEIGYFFQKLTFSPLPKTEIGYFFSEVNFFSPAQN